MDQETGSCSPEQLHTLQKIFDLIWMELRAAGSSRFSGPIEPDILRTEIARRVMAYADEAEMTADEITDAVLLSFGIRKIDWKL
jgi:hypothetical protein